ncbi:MAG: aminotransferase class III-fold pyridoxal phosphate-dependent enzyme [Nitrospinota bacterium]|nr:aminotransferase class III-fold pyridoxal phosphate-dependent enzyme [Nitrospinota bacterium]
MTDKKFKIDRSNEIYRRAEKIIPAGTQTFSKGVNQFVTGFAPKYLQRGKGAYVWDADGNKFLDYVMGCHPIILGYADQDVNSAIIEQLELGSTFSLANELEVDVTELLIETIPCAEAARFGKNGADATSVAVRIARAVTGRDHIAYCGYHGWHDWYIANTDLNSGIPKFNEQLAHSFTYNNLDSLEQIFKQNKGKVACVIMEPLTVLEPEDNFLHKVKEMAHHHGALLIFDEIITGFRFSLGGAQELTGVTPDLAAFAKAISNGVPLSAIVGKKEYMFALEKTFFSFTYGGDCIGLSAAKACIPKIRREKVPDHLNEVGSLLKDNFNKLADQYGLTEFTGCVGYPCRTVVTFDGQGRFDSLEMKSYFQQELLRRGILWAGYHALSFSHQREDIEMTLNAFEDVMKLFKKIVDGSQSLRSFIEGEPVKPVFRNIADFNSYVVKNR